MDDELWDKYANQVYMLLSQTLNLNDIQQYYQNITTNIDHVNKLRVQYQLSIYFAHLHTALLDAAKETISQKKVNSTAWQLQLCRPKKIKTPSFKTYQQVSILLDTIKLTQSSHLSISYTNFNTRIINVNKNDQLNITLLS